MIATLPYSLFATTFYQKFGKASITTMGLKTLKSPSDYYSKDLIGSASECGNSITE
jgi:hypothetical protein